MTVKNTLLEDSEDAAHEREYYRGLWVENRTAMDRTLFLASSAGAGFATTLLFNQKPPFVLTEVAALVVALVLFVVSAVTVFFIYHQNAKYLLNRIANPNASEDDKKLNRLDWLARGAIAAAMAAISVAVAAYLSHPTT